MKTLSTVTHRPHLVTAAIFGALALSFGAISAAAEGNDVHQAVVNVSDLDVSNWHDDATLYSRIERAADEVCEAYATDDSQPGTLSEAQQDACVHEAITNAVNQVGLPQLSAIYAAKNPELR